MIPVRLIATGKAVPSHSVTSASLDLKLGHPAGYTPVSYTHLTLPTILLV